MNKLDSSLKSTKSTKMNIFPVDCLASEALSDSFEYIGAL